MSDLSDTTVGNEVQLAEDKLMEAIKHLHNATDPECGEHCDYKQSYISKLIGWELQLRDIIEEMNP